MLKLLIEKLDLMTIFFFYLYSIKVRIINCIQRIVLLRQINSTHMYTLFATVCLHE